ncbi:RCAR3 INTERACTING F-BOX PROTEIN 1 [Hibiscus trionum]|uniref:RCAR3 INTERACTING F-BOX PROTEIN 1 n=2 Tax=Hibiscus trionum TaxID=183268 RepID=A0A9W7J7K6_HIBTR|nr:RCAR3 INTERACTING F-BOX PROTEIN 1 [Hibiscus trionum]
MALNFSHQPIFPGHLTEDRVSPIRMANGYLVEGIPQRNGDGCKGSWHSNHDCFDYERDKSCARFGSHESVSNDIIDLLPSDPFGMDISTTFTAITGWLEDLEIDYGRYVRNDVQTGDDSYQLFAGLNFIWNNTMWFQTLPGECKGSVSGGFGEPSRAKERGNVSDHAGFGSACNAKEILCFRNEDVVSVDQGDDEFQDCEVCSEEHEGAPHEALILALGYLNVRDLFAVESVCMSLRSAVQNDPLLWRNVHIDQPLSEKITDDVLLQITRRAQGSLQCLSLVDCQRVTDEGLKCVVEENPKLVKLSVPGCTRLSIEGILNSLKALKSAGRQGVKHLRIAGVYGVTLKHFEELKLLGMDNQIQQIMHKPLFYNRKNVYLSDEDDRAIDIELCPRCNNVRLVYDCPVEGCQQKGHTGQLCRACTLCIARCVVCGRCINDGEYEETFSLELLCSDCWRLQVKS